MVSNAHPTVACENYNDATHLAAAAWIGGNHTLQSFNVDNVADYVILNGEPRTTRVVTHLKLQKLVYYAQAYVLAFTGKSLFMSPIQAWRYGPVCPKLYAVYQRSSFTELKPTAAVVAGAKRLLADDLEEPLAVIDDMLDVYGAYAGSVLETMTRQETPWASTKAHGRNLEIPQRLIKTYFDEVLGLGANHGV